MDIQAPDGLTKECIFVAKTLVKRKIKADADSARKGLRGIIAEEAKGFVAGVTYMLARDASALGMAGILARRTYAAVREANQNFAISGLPQAMGGELPPRLARKQRFDAEDALTEYAKTVLSRKNSKTIMAIAEAIITNDTDQNNAVMKLTIGKNLPVVAVKYPAGQLAAQRIAALRRTVKRIKKSARICQKTDQHGR